MAETMKSWLVLFVPVVRPTERNVRWLVREQPVCVYDAQIDIGEAGDIARRARRARHKALHNGLIHHDKHYRDPRGFRRLKNIGARV